MNYHNLPYGEGDVIGRLQRGKASAPRAFGPAFDYAIELAVQAEAETEGYMSPYSDKAWSNIVHYPTLCWLLAEGIPEKPKSSTQ